MYGLVFYLSKTELKKAYGENHHDAYEEIRNILRHYGFHWLSNSFYFSRVLNCIAQIFQAVQALKQIPWFVSSLVSLHVFKMEDMSNFTSYLKDGEKIIKEIDEEEFDSDIEEGKHSKYKR